MRFYKNKNMLSFTKPLQSIDNDAFRDAFRKIGINCVSIYARTIKNDLKLALVRCYAPKNNTR
jgi:hypothetical protein